MIILVRKSGKFAQAVFQPFFISTRKYVQSYSIEIDVVIYIQSPVYSQTKITIETFFRV